MWKPPSTAAPAASRQQDIAKNACGIFQFRRRSSLNQLLGRFQRLGVDGFAQPVAQSHGEQILLVQINMAEELPLAIARRLVGGTGLGELDLRAEGAIHFIWPEGTGVDRAGHEFPELVELAEGGALWRIVVGRAVVHVGSQEDHILDAAILDGLEQSRQFQFAA